ncbi:unnamed protein product, partial [Brenthis ino]
MAGKMYIGNVDYDESEKFSDYIERFEMFLECNKIEAARWKAVFLSVIGSKLFSLLKNLCTPVAPRERTYEELKKILMNHLEPKPNVITERYKFGQRCQMSGESINTYLAELKKLSLYCNYGENLTEQIRDKFISGLSNEKIKQKLLNESEVTLEKAYNIAVQLENTDRDLEVMTSKVHRIGVAGKKRGGQRNDTCGQLQQSARSNNKLCKCCGKGGHLKEVCWFKDRKCRSCGKIGHLLAVCRFKKGKKLCNYIENEHNQDIVLEDIQNLFTLSDTHVSPYKLELQINNKKVMFEIDTGAAISVISQYIKNKYFNDSEMYKCNLKLRSYVNDLITPLGFINVDIAYDKKKMKAKLYVIENGGPSLIGRDLLKKINIKTLNINSLSCENIKDKLVSKFPEVFSSELGTYKGEQVNLVLKENVSPKYYKARSLPFSMKQLVEEEINRLYKQELQKKYAGGSRVRELEIGKSVLARDYRSNSNKWMEGIILDNQINSNLDDDTFDTELVFKDKEYPSVCNETSSSVIIKSPNTVCSNSVVRKSEILPSVEKNVSNGSQLKEIVSSPQKTESSPLVLKRSVRIRKKPDRLNL